MMRSALNAIEAHSEHTAMIGDRMDTDVVAGLEAGLHAVLVLHRREHPGDGRTLSLPAVADRRVGRRPRGRARRGRLAYGSRLVSVRRIATNGIELNVVEEGEGPRRALPRLPRARLLLAPPDPRARAGRLPRRSPRTCAATARARCPPSVEAYDVLSLCGDLCGLLDALGEESAIFVGHDWGASVVWYARRDPPRARARGGGAERPVRAARAGAADPDHAPPPRRGLLHRLVPAARRGRRGARAATCAAR